jgi:hypothetical protein
MCSVKWCDETDGHNGPHTRYLGDVAGAMTTDRGTAIVHVVLRGDTAPDRHVELVISNTATVTLVLTWPQVRLLSAVMHVAHRKYAT